MILTVTLNPALDLTYTVDALAAHRTHRVGAVAEHPGGKGLNVARVLHALGEPVLATGLLGGGTGERVAALLAEVGVPGAFVPLRARTRRTVAVVDPVDVTNFSEPGPPVTAGEWTRFADQFTGLVGGAAVVVLSGSLPPGVPADAYGSLIRLAHARDVPVLLDASGHALRHGAAAGPDIVKPNHAELAELARHAGLAPTAAGVLALGPRAAVVSRGHHGLEAASRGGGSWRAAPPERVAGNATGAGDACAAALARGLREATAWPSLLADAVALSAAAVAAPVAGAVDLPTYTRLRPLVDVTPTPTSAGAADADPDR